MTVKVTDKASSAQQAHFPKQNCKNIQLPSEGNVGCILQHAYRPVGHIDILEHLREEVHHKDQRCDSISQFFFTPLFLLHQHHQ